MEDAPWLTGLGCFYRLFNWPDNCCKLGFGYNKTLAATADNCPSHPWNSSREGKGKGAMRRRSGKEKGFE